LLNDRKLISVEQHFAFGDNWAEYAKNISARDIDEAIDGLRRLLGEADLEGKRFLDIGSGSGIHSLAALRLGASEVVAIDLDPKSVSTTQHVLQRHTAGSRYIVKQASVFDLDPGDLGTFDVVYSWGVLHHTGDLDRAIRKAAAMVEPGGEFVFALYHRTWLCPFWTIEKKWYAKASNYGQTLVRSIYIAIAVLRRWLRGHSFRKFVQRLSRNHLPTDSHLAAN
jgi:2-polyprenyl-3-methyl-5-hydroxy-6-metoxy-1,4-benzoquinol methylase